MARRLVSEADVAEAVRRRLTTMPVDQSTIITPAARDLATKHRIEFTTSVAAPSAHVASVTMLAPKDKRSPHATTIIALGSDHGGYQMKEHVKNLLLDLGYSVADVGTQSEQACDYPDFAYAVAALVSSGRAAKGIMVDAVGVASAIVANKVPGVRAAVGFSELAARSSREHNDANVLTLGGRVLGTEAANAIVKVWLETWFGGGRHQTRIQKISDIEQRFSKQQ